MRRIADGQVRIFAFSARLPAWHRGNLVFFKQSALDILVLDDGAI
jgi:hypothetical protein